MDLWALIIVPLGLRLVVFAERCTVGSSLLFVKYLEGKDRTAKTVETVAFTATRDLFIGGLGATAPLVGTAFVRVQHWFWILLGAAYAWSIRFGLRASVGPDRNS